MPDNIPQSTRLPFPLDYNNQLIIKTGLFVSGTITLASGSGTFTDPRIRTTSIPLICYNTNTNPGTLRAAVTDKTLTVTSSSGTDASVVFFLILL